MSKRSLKRKRECFLCNHPLDQKRVLQHLNRRHAKVGIQVASRHLRCPFEYCGEHYSNVRLLYGHLAQRHVLSEKRECCGQWFANEGALWRHEVRNHKEKMTKNPCLYWDKVEIVDQSTLSSSISFVSRMLE